MIHKVLSFAPLVALAGCLNMPTPEGQIAGIEVSGLEFASSSCEELRAEMDSLTRREKALAQAQNQRVKNSEIQGFLYGFGQGDGMEASELAVVRGRLEAVKRTIAEKGC